MIWIRALCITAVLFISACSPLVNHPGKPVREPGIEAGHYTADDGTVMPLHSWLPQEKPLTAVLVGVHGFNDYSYSFAIPGTYLTRYGIGTYAYDQRGFGGSPERGLWSGIDAYTRDLTVFAREIRKRHPDVPLYILGESMGGAVAIVAMTGNDPPPAEGVILVAPAVWGRDTMPWYQRALLAVTSHTLPWLELTGNGLDIVPSDNLEMRRALHSDPKVIKGTRVDAMHGLVDLMDEAMKRVEKLRCPTLIQYGKHDQVIPKEPIFTMLDRTPPTTRRAFYEQGYHMLLRDLHREKPLLDIVAWIADHNKPLPYGTASWK